MKIDTKTQLCAVIGNPIEHSLSPIMHNAAYLELGLNFVYLAFKVDDVKHAVLGMKGLGIRGLSVTVPHKQSVMPYLDKIDPLAEKIGAVNTIVNEADTLIGSNTDYVGAIRALEEKTTLADKNVVVIGSGGAARAIAFGLKEKGAKIVLLNRSEEKAKELAEKIDGKGFGLTKLSEVENADILIQTTPMGMHPNVEESIIPKEHLHKNLIVFDIVYNPRETRLIKDAKEKGCEIVYGYKMLLYQAVAQFELFTSRQAPVTIMEKALVDALNTI